MNPDQAWQAALGQLQMEMPKAAYETWVGSSRLVGYEPGCFRVSVRNAFTRDWLESRMASTIQSMLSGMMNREETVQFIVAQAAGERGERIEPILFAAPEPAESTPAFEAPHRSQATINTRYTFDNFVVGASNRLAHAASMAVAENPAMNYNPLFLYGGVGLGKTHLLHAIGNTAAKSGMQVLYCSSEEFTNDLINAIRTHNTPAFRDRYRQIDVLLIDDIQFIAGKESTQEEFFHTFNTLHGQNKQIVITSDRPPKSLVTLEERLQSRFAGGLTADVQPPDLETRIAILRSKALRGRSVVPDEILEYIARHVQSNIRELEGALTRVLAFAALSGLPLTIQLVDSALADMLPQRREIDPAMVINAVARMFGLDSDKLLSRDRSREVALPRQIVMYLLREEANISLPQIGDALGGRDHTTVMYACDKIADMLERDDRLRRQMIQIREQLYSTRLPA